MKLRPEFFPISKYRIKHFFYSTLKKNFFFIKKTTLNPLHHPLNFVKSLKITYDFFFKKLYIFLFKISLNKLLQKYLFFDNFICYKSPQL